MRPPGHRVSDTYEDGFSAWKVLLQFALLPASERSAFFCCSAGQEVQKSGAPMNPEETGQNERPIPAPRRGVVAPVDVTVAGGDFSRAVVGTQIVNKNTVVHHHGTGTPGNSSLPPGHFCLNALITVSEVDPISRDSRIYRAKLHSDILDDLEIVVKILSDGERQRREARIHYLVPHHRNIVERIMTDTFKYQGQSCIYIAMEQCDAQNLHAYVVSLAEANAPYDADMFMDFAFQIATGLEFLHRHKILNRDLKPENILLSSDKTVVKIADFGMSKEMIGEAATVSALQLGTDGWRSPEILKKDERITLASDIFSLGLIFHFLWSFGKHAFGDDPHAWNLYIKKGINMTLDGLKIPNINAARALLTSMFKQNPAERPNALVVLRDKVFRGPRLQSGAAAIYYEVSEMKVVETIKNQEPDVPQQGSSSFLGRILRRFDKKPVKKTVSSKSGRLSADLQPGSLKDGEDEPSSPAIEKSVTLSESNTELMRESVVTFDIVDSFGSDKVYRGRMNMMEVLVWQCNQYEPPGFENMFLALSNLEHMNIIKFYGQVSTPPYLVVTEFMPQTLHDYLKMNGAEITPDIFHMAAQIASGMEYISTKGFVHANLRAACVRVDDDLHCKIADFTVTCKMREGIHYPEQGVKCPIKWTAPEVFFYGESTTKSDVWSFGILLTEMVTGGGTPYPVMRNREVIEQVECGYRMPKPIECPKALYDEVMMPCWDKDADKRPTFQWLKKTMQDFFATGKTEESLNITDCSLRRNAELKASEEEEQFPTSVHLSEENLKFHETIGSFAFGGVWRGEVCSRKAVIFKYDEKDTDDEQEFDEAIIAFRSLQHENVIKYLGMHPVHPRVIATEFLRHGTMLEYLTNGDGKRATPYDIRQMAGQVAAGMSYIHLKGFIHRDLRAGNIMVGENHHCKISGLAQARRVDDKGQCEFHNVFKVSAAWASPETFNSDFNSRKSDVWSFGVLLIEMTSGGQMPHKGKSHEERINLVESGYHLPRPWRCPANLYRIIKICWNMDLDNRPTFDWLEKSMVTYTNDSDKDSEKNFGKTVRALYDFKARDDRELSFQEGDIILDVKREEEMWLLGTLHGIRAFFPSNYVVEIK